MAAAEWDFKLAKPLKGGGTLREVFAAYRRDTGRSHPDDDWPYPVPAAGQHLLNWFWELNVGRQGAMGAWFGLPATEILAWSQLRRIRVRPWEVEALRRLDATFLRVMSEDDG